MVMAKKPEQEFEKAPAGVHLARCVRLIDLGTQLSAKFQTYQHKVRLYFELPHCLMQKGDFAGKPMIISKIYTLSLSEKSHLRNDLKSWRGRDFTDQELAGFDLNNVVDKCCQLNIVHEKEYANVAAIIPLSAGTTIPPRVHDLIIFDLARFDQKVFDSLTDNTKETIKQSLEYQDMMDNENTLQQMADDQAQAEFDDDIPF